MRRFLVLLAGAWLSMAARQSNRSLLYQATPHGTIGEASTLHLMGSGVAFTPLSNDAFGETDKLMTGSTRLAWQRAEGERSFMVSLFWRSLTPIFRKHIDQDDLAEPVGSFADWAELQSGYAGRMPTLPAWAPELRYQVLVGVGHIGDKGLKAIHSRIHRLANVPQGNLQYGGQPVGLTGTLGLQADLLLQQPWPLLLQAWDLKLVSGVYRNLAMFDLYAGFNATSVWPGTLRLGVEARLARQLTSALYESPRAWRYELAAGLRSSGGLLAAVKYVSPYLKQDDVRQIYLEISMVRDRR